MSHVHTPAGEHFPWFEHMFGQVFMAQFKPRKPSAHWQTPSTHFPRPEQSSGQAFTEQSAPINGFSHTHLKLSKFHVQSSLWADHGLASNANHPGGRYTFVVAAPCSAESLRQTNAAVGAAPSWVTEALAWPLAPQIPWREQSFSQTMMEQSAPFHPGSLAGTACTVSGAIGCPSWAGWAVAHVQLVTVMCCPLFSHFPWPEQSFGHRGYEQSTPRHCGSQVQLPLRQVPWSLQSFGQARSLQSSPAKPA